MTDINHQLSVVTSFLTLLASVYPTKPLRRLSSWLQGTIILPNAMIICRDINLRGTFQISVILGQSSEVSLSIPKMSCHFLVLILD